MCVYGKLCQRQVLTLSPHDHIEDSTIGAPPPCVGLPANRKAGPLECKTTKSCSVCSMSMNVHILLLRVGFFRVSYNRECAADRLQGSFTSRKSLWAGGGLPELPWLLAARRPKRPPGLRGPSATRLNCTAGEQGYPVQHADTNTGQSCERLRAADHYKS